MSFCWPRGLLAAWSPAAASAATIVIDKDATGALRATWTSNNEVYADTTGGTGAWGTPFVIPVAGTTVCADDISSVVSFAGSIARCGAPRSTKPCTSPSIATAAQGHSKDGNPAAVAPQLQVQCG